MSYTILCNSSYQTLAAEVCQYINDGYRPHGNMVVEPATHPEGDAYYYQPMLKEVA